MGYIHKYINLIYFIILSTQCYTFRYTIVNGVATSQKLSEDIGNIMRWFKTKKEAQKFFDNKNNTFGIGIFKDKSAKHKTKPFAVCSEMVWINRN